MTTPEDHRATDDVGDRLEETTDEQSSHVADKAELERAVEEKTAAVRELAEADPKVSQAEPAKKRTP